MHRSPRSLLLPCLVLCLVHRITCAPNLSAQEDLVGLEEAAMRAATRRVAPSVVRIETLGGLEQVQGQLLGTGPTTGLIVSEDGYILSSAFGFLGQPASILVTLPSGRRVSARIVARDHSRMLVLLKVDVDEPLPVPVGAPREQLGVGQWTLAVGRTYSGEYPNVSVGVLSALNRIWGKAIQTDAKVSPGNYGGPLIDIRGRVIGILVPLSPQQQDEMAGAEWYDSGIGFAVPLADILPRLDTMKPGNDLYPGILGISLKGSAMHSLPATIAACPAKSPAREAGLQVGDTVVEIDGVPIERQSQLKHALGPRYAGESIRIVVERGEQKQRVEATVELVAELQPYVRPELGILPMRGMPAEGTEAGVVVRTVIPAGPAAEAGLGAGDRITALNNVPTPDAAALREALIAFEPETEVSLTYVRDQQPRTITLQLARCSTTLPESLPPAYGDRETTGDPTPAVGVVEIQIPEMSNKCVAYVPENYAPSRAHGLVVWLHAPGRFDQDELIQQWKPLCDQHQLILLAPQAADEQRWTVPEIEFVRKTIDNVLSTYAIDPNRVVTHGYRAGAAMAYYVALAQREICRGVAPVAAPLPRRMATPETDPLQPLAIYSCSSPESEVAELIQAGEKRLQEKAFPVTIVTLPGPERYLNADEMTALARWIDTLDRI